MSYIKIIVIVLMLLINMQYPAYCDAAVDSWISDDVSINNIINNEIQKKEVFAEGEDVSEEPFINGSSDKTNDENLSKQQNVIVDRTILWNILKTIGIIVALLIVILVLNSIRKASLRKFNQESANIQENIQQPIESVNEPISRAVVSFVRHRIKK